MPRTQAPKMQRPVQEVPDKPEWPVGPDAGRTSPLIPDDPEHDRLVDPAARQLPAGPRRAKAPQSTPDLPLPHERDESPDPTPTAPDPVIVQAKRDLDAGLVDTDMRATPGLDAARRRRMVPGPGGKPPSER